MFYRFLLLLSISFTFTVPVASQTEPRGENCPICKDGEHLNGNPYQKGIKTELPYLISGIGLVGTGFLLQALNTTDPFTIDEIDRLDRNSVNPFDRPATYNWDPNMATASDYLALGAMALPAFFLSTKHSRSQLGSLVVMGLEVGMINFGITSSVKNLSSRARPYVYNPNVPMDERTSSLNRKSFFSGHTSHTAAFSFFFAKVLNDYHPNMKTGLKITIWTVAIAVPVSTAYLRVESGKHFKTDVITGFMVGAATGWFVPQLHKKKKGTSAFSVFPTTIFGRPGMYLSYRF
ncbi:MAG: phosphatase PAP2 family protein [Chlorobi bacterium]|nr:phosphatase PAP2 family protein [Chlorobiota bacterium]